MLTTSFAYAGTNNMLVEIGIAEKEKEVETRKFITLEDLGVTEEEFDLLCSITFTEGGAENDYGQQLVVHTIMNRVEYDGFGDTIEDVIFAQNQFDGINSKNFKRFTHANFGDAYLTVAKNVTEALTIRMNKEMKDYEKKIFFFHNPKYVSKNYMQKNRLVEIVSVGGHRFCGFGG
jgi:spore germination cell wall hydrolase CwlJ-like protein